MEREEDIFGRICRVCLTPGTGKTETLIDKNKENGLSVFGEALLRFAEISIVSTEFVLPTSLCQDCLSLLKNAIKFKLMCETNNKRLEKIAFKKKTFQKADIVDYCMFIQYFPHNFLNNEEHESHEDEVDAESEYASDNDNIDEYSKQDLLDLMEQCIPMHRDTAPKRAQTKKETRELKRQLRLQRLQEEKGKKYSCEVCHKVLSSKRYYQNHMQAHEGYKVICEVCGRGFPAGSQLRRHQARAHGAGPLLRCDHCGYGAACRYELTEHLRSHSAERPFTCGVCPAAFRRRAVLRAHLAAHRPRTVQCPHCPRTFARRSDARAHCNGAHRRAYVFACARCGAAFAKRASVYRHAAARHGAGRAGARVLRVILPEQESAAGPGAGMVARDKVLQQNIVQK